VSPGIPFLVPLLFGVLVSFTAGDLLFFLLDLVGVL
jgi:preflagellin peptidase FlaK